MPTKKPPAGPLTPFEGLDVLQIALRVKGAGDGLSKALAISPVEHHSGDDVTVIMRCKVGAISYEQIKDTDALRRVETLVAGTATVVADDGVIAEQLDEQERKLEEAQGIKRLDFEGGQGDEPGADTE